LTRDSGQVLAGNLPAGPWPIDSRQRWHSYAIGTHAAVHAHLEPRTDFDADDVMHIRALITALPGDYRLTVALRVDAA
jgi:hypothetical protein